MATNTRTRESARNQAAVAYLREVKANLEPKVTYADIADAMGIREDQVKRLMTNKAELTVDQFITIAIALRLDPAEAMSHTLGKAGIQL